MIRAFVALPLPPDVQARLAVLSQMLPLPRRLPAAALHLTLLFLGEIAEPEAEQAHLSFQAVVAPGFELRLRGAGLFGGDRPRAVYAATEPQPALDRLQARLVQAARSAGLTVERRRFVPHVTLARLRPGEADPRPLEQALVQCAGFAAGPFRVDHFCLYRSHLGRAGAEYEELARYALE